MTTTPFALNTLVQPSTTVTQTLPTGLAADMIYLLASATDQVVQAYMQGLSSLTSAMLSALPSANNATSYEQIGNLFTASEALGFGATTATTGAYVSVPIGAALQALDSSNTPRFTVIALRGTQTYQEWVNDLTAVPQAFKLGVLPPFDLGCVHSGIYSVYTVGTDGLQPSSPNSRASGSLADQINQLVTGSTWPSTLPLFVTGHSLGAALAELCAIDVAYNMSKFMKSVTMVNFAPPRVSAGLLDDGTTLEGDIYDPKKFVKNFQKYVQNSFSVVNAADLVPIMPPTLGSASSVQVAFNPVVPSQNVVMYCAQLGDVGSNHELTTNYLPYAQALAAAASS